MRDIAGDVGVDAALVSRYFGSKEELFLMVLDSCSDGRDLMDGARSDFGRRVARDVIFEGRNEGKLKKLLIMLRSIGSAKAMDLVQRTGSESFFDPFAAWIGGEDASVRARLAAATIMGMAVSREVTAGFGLTPEECERLAERMGDLLQGIVDN